MIVRPSFRGTPDGGVAVRLPAWLRALLAQQFDDLAQLLGADAPEGATSAGAPDPFAQLTDLGGPVEPPDDPVLRRLRPDGYAPAVDEGAAAADFRRFTQGELAALQRRRVATVRASLEIGDRFGLDADGAQAWLGALNDLRIALGTRLGVSEDPDDVPAPEDPAFPAWEVYGLLGHVQHLLLVALGAPEEF